MSDRTKKENSGDFLGAHMSIAGGLHKAVERGRVAGCGVLQVFTQNSNQWRGKRIADSDAALFREAWEESGMRDIVSHDIYLINLAAAPGEVREKSMAGFLEEMEPLARAHTPAGREGEAIYRVGRTTASYVHFYFPSNPAAVAALLG